MTFIYYLQHLYNWKLTILIIIEEADEAEVNLGKLFCSDLR